ncbi:hypothetical protein TA3x_001913 [Tundrisphaera sp. TA3]|uniref:hypothetical protein n=1 Tax=Tundrisphaera sp. TA3 TaxID=3435775 RepID=UPI003EBFFFC3
MRRFIGCLIVGASIVVGLGGDAPQSSAEASASRRADQAALKEYGSLVGTWKGTGQPKRGQSKGAWTEGATWAWKLAPDAAALAVEFEKGKYLRSAVLRPGKGPGSFRLDATLADGSAREFTGQGEAGKPLILRAEQARGGLARIILTIPNESRFLLLLDEANPGASTAIALARLGEVGYTRQGVAFAAGGASGPECIVTGGRGTIKVSHQGKEYWVCCSGCRDLFNAEPAAILAESAAKSKAAASGK